ncbi:MAG: alpha/beta fold hydrolase [Myxococcaceae bacterium]|nr:alpha/beta fold hydrolase [Myxococcaceae bacterium]
MPFQVTHPFVPSRSLPSPHAQTLFASFARGPKLAGVWRERWETDDNDFIDVDRIEGGPNAPVLVLLHGLEGSSRAGYIRETLHLAGLRGWSALALNFRSCSGEPNRQLASYCAGDYRDVKWCLSKLDQEGRTGPRFAVGFSLGGNVLLKLLADEPGLSLTAAAAVSVPYDLAACTARLDGRGLFSFLYRQWFLYPLKKKGLHKARQFPTALDAAAIRAARGIYAFDDAVTAKVFGFACAREYYARSSSGPLLRHIRVPTLLISAEDDPLAPASMLPLEARENPALTVVTTRQGGHVGFVEGSWRAPHYWAEQQVLHFLASIAARHVLPGVMPR